MKKWIALLLSVVLCLAIAMPALAEGELVGGWTITTDATIPADVLETANKAIGDLAGSQIEPIALLATQVVAGTNYCILCRSTALSPDAAPVYTMMYLYVDLEGAAEIIGFADIDVPASSPLSAEE